MILIGELWILDMALIVGFDLLLNAYFLVEMLRLEFLFIEMVTYVESVIHLNRIFAFNGDAQLFSTSFSGL